MCVIGLCDRRCSAVGREPVGAQEDLYAACDQLSDLGIVELHGSVPGPVVHAAGDQQPEEFGGFHWVWDIEYALLGQFGKPVGEGALDGVVG